MEELEMEVLVKKEDNSKVNGHIYKEINLLEEYEYDMYFPEEFERKNKKIVFEESKSLYQRVKDEVMVWLITGTVVEGAYVINELVDNYIVK